MSSKGLTGAAAERNRQRAREWRARPGNAEREAATKQARRDADPERWRAQRRAAATRYWEKNRDAINARQAGVRAELRLLVIAAYGGRCSCPGCHVIHAELLTVDHVNGDARHRQNRRSTRDIYRQIVAAGFPDNVQLLCGSCNLAKSDKDKCPLAGEDH